MVEVKHHECKNDIDTSLLFFFLLLVIIFGGCFGGSCGRR